MAYCKKFLVEPHSKVRLEKIDPSYTGKHESPGKAEDEIASNLERLRKAQYLLYADAGQSLLVVLQGLDASGKDGVIQHLFSGVNPMGVNAVRFNPPSAAELAHDFLWRVHAQAPAKGEIVIFNRSHYEDVLVVRVHKLVPKAVWSKRYELINDFENMLSRNGTRILKFYLHISPKEQLDRFKQRLDDPSRQWKISEADYSERELWPKYISAYEDALSLTSTDYAPWFVIPSNHKWFRNLAISQIIADTMAAMKLKLPPARADIGKIRSKYHDAKAEADGLESKAWRQR
ncbi:MAG: polyphosphate kinase 2 family protein [Rhodomicrobium sp.]